MMQNMCSLLLFMVTALPMKEKLSFILVWSLLLNPDDLGSGKTSNVQVDTTILNDATTCSFVVSSIEILDLLVPHHYQCGLAKGEACEWISMERSLENSSLPQIVCFQA